jgi:DMSO/TMAO reductase YedYZ heme-binding membrane subunit
MSWDSKMEVGREKRVRAACVTNPPKNPRFSRTGNSSFFGSIPAVFLENAETPGSEVNRKCILDRSSIRLVASAQGGSVDIHRVIGKTDDRALAEAKKGRSKPLSFHDYAVAIGISLGLTLCFGVYDVFRRGYLFGAPPTADPFFVPNKIIIATGLAMLAFTFLIGPLARYFDAFDQLVQYRKEIGVVGGFFALFHVIVSYFLLPHKFPRSGMNFIGVVYGAGLIATFIVIFLLLITTQSAVDLLGNRWWFLHRWGLRVLIFFAVIHTFVMKWNHAWVAWVMHDGGNPPSAELANAWLPGLGMLTNPFLAWVIIVRLYETIFLFKDLGLKPKEISRDERLGCHGHRFVIGSFCMLIAGYVFLFTRWVL